MGGRRPLEPQARTRFTDATATVADLMKLVADFVAEREWEPFHDAKNLSASIAIEAAELMEHFQWLRSDELGNVRRDTAKLQEIAEETADIAAYLLSFASRMGIDLSAALADKMQKNARKYPSAKYRGRFEA
ncbi:MAG: nucleotide pyrophosphohydrolase [Planctomycetes bacterium]|nr:nucleotide pyrophosphohydrolase [Planctomycetota bacterium]